MAFCTVSYLVMDADGATDTFVFRALLDGVSFPILQDMVNDFTPLVDAITDGVITDVSVSLSFDLPAGLKAAAVAGSSCRRQGAFTYSLVNSPYVETFTIPAFNESFFSGKGVNTSHPTVDNFTVRFDIEDGIPAGGYILLPCNRFEKRFNHLVKATKVWRK